MQHKLLLGSGALVSTGLLMAGGAQAEEMRVGGIEVVLGGPLGFGDLTLGVGNNRQDEFAPGTHDNDIVNVGLKFGLGAANVSFGGTFNRFGDSDLDDGHLFVVTGDAAPARRHLAR